VSHWRRVTKTAAVSLHGNTYQVEPALAGLRVPENPAYDG
jgi:hypothetical protein